MEKLSIFKCAKCGNMVEVLHAGGGALSILLLWGQCRRLGLLRCEARRLRLARLRRAGGGA